MGLIPPYYRDIWSHKTSETLFFLLFSQCRTGVQEKSMISSLLQAINFGTILSGTASKSWCHNIGTSRHELQKLYKKRPNYFQTLTFCRNLGFQKPGICPRQPPGGFIFPEMTPPQKYFLENCKNIKKRIFLFYKMACFFMLFFQKIPAPKTEFVRQIPVGRGVCFGRSHMLFILYWAPLRRVCV